MIAVLLPASPTWAAGNGRLDRTFGSEGKVLTDFSGPGRQDTAQAVAVQSDGRIVAAGQSDANDFALARYNRDGSLDTTFGSHGKVLTDINGAGSADRANAVAIQSNGKIVAAGTAGADGRFAFALVRYNRDGSLDTTFGSAGKVLTDFGTNGYDLAMAMAIQPDGRILAIGRSDTVRGNDFALARYNRDGSLDATFGNRGKILTDVSGAASDDVASIVALQANGKIVIAGYSGVRGVTYDFALARYNNNGRLDRGFGTGGKVVTDINGAGSVDRAVGVALQADGRIVAVGVSNARGDDDFALVRYNGNGSLDRGFGTAGTVLTDISGGGSTDTGMAVVIESYGRILVAGSSNAQGNSDFVLARYNYGGTLDRGFGTGGTVLTDFSGAGSTEFAVALALQGNDRIVAAGSSDAGGSLDFALARYRL